MDKKRDVFRREVLARDGSNCVVCKKRADTVHHILDRRLFPDGGYDATNGVSLCEEHHWRAESTFLTCEILRAAAGINVVTLPPGFSPSFRYDKWGNIILEDGTRKKGPLFDDPGHQKMLRWAGLLDRFSRTQQERA